MRVTVFCVKQKTLFKLSEYSSEFGGSLNLSTRKSRRPLSPKNALKVVLRGEIQKSGSLLKHRNIIDQAFIKFAKRFDIRIYEKAIVSNHIHFVALFGSRDRYKKFIRALTGAIASKNKIILRLSARSNISRARKSHPTLLRASSHNCATCGFDNSNPCCRLRSHGSRSTIRTCRTIT